MRGKGKGKTLHGRDTRHLRGEGRDGRGMGMEDQGMEGDELEGEGMEWAKEGARRAGRTTGGGHKKQYVRTCSTTAKRRETKRERERESERGLRTESWNCHGHASLPLFTRVPHFPSNTSFPIHGNCSKAMEVRSIVLVPNRLHPKRLRPSKAFSFAEVCQNWFLAALSGHNKKTYCKSVLHHSLPQTRQVIQTQRKS